MKPSPFAADDVSVKSSVFGMLRWLWPYFMQRKLVFFAVLGAVFSVAAAARVSVSLFGYAIDEGLRAKNMNVVLAVAVGFFLLEAGRAYMTFIQGYMFAKFGNRILFDIRDRLIRHVEHLPISYFEKNPTGRIVTRVTTDVTSLGEVFTQGLISMFAACVALVAIVVAMLFISVKVSIATLLVAPVMATIVVMINRRLLVQLRESKRRIAAINAFVAENINGMRVTQLYGRIDRNVKRFHEMSGDYRTQQLRLVRMYAMLWPAVSFFNATSVGTALFFGGYFVLNGEVTTGAMIAFILHVRAFSDPLSQILERYQNLQNSLSGAERIFTLFEEPTEPARPAGAPESARVRGRIEFRGVSFQYGPELPLALRNIDLTTEPGESVALVGRTGSGKSTLIALLQRFYDPTSGTILVDGESILDIERHRLRSRIGVVQQDTFLFRGTIAQNISLGDPRITRERIEHAARMAYLDEVVARKADGLDAKVEERGANLSVGERQLIAFARILAFDPDILILDEATANIDSRTEHYIQEATRRVREGRTSFIIAHRISTILDCDKIVVLDEGRIVESGAHEELFAKGGVYAGLCRAQMKST